MDDTRKQAPAGWLEALAESDADLEAGRIVPGEVIRQEFLDSLARMKAKRDQQPRRGTAQRR